MSTFSGTNALFSTQAIATSGKPPVVIVGLPRSGSSFLAHVASHLDDWFIFDDLYLYREAKAINATDAPLTHEQMDKLLFFLGWQIRARIKYGVFCVPDMTLNDVDKMNSALAKTFQDKPVYWHELQEEWMTRLTINQGAKYWGYKAPQDFQLINLLSHVYPNIKVIYLFRDPRNMLRSFKYVRDQDGNPEQYHPVVYSYYWKKAIKTLDTLTQTIPERILPIKYEELASNPQDTADEIAVFLNTSVNKPIEKKRSNSSFNTEVKHDITPTEKRICEIITNELLNKHGYNQRYGKFRVRDLPDLIKTTFIFSAYQIKRLFLSKSARVSIKMFVQGLFKK